MHGHGLVRGQFGHDGHVCILSHPVQRHAARWNRQVMAVLDPQHHVLARRRGGQVGVTVGGPGIGVMGDGQAGIGALPSCLQRVFDHVMACYALRMDKQLPGKFRQAKPAADLGTVDDDGLAIARHVIIPCLQHVAVLIEQAQPQPHGPRTVARPVIGGDQTGGQRRRIPEKGKVGGEVQPVQVVMRDRKHVPGQPHGFQRMQHPVRRQQAGQAALHDSMVEIQRPHGPCPALRQIHYRLQDHARTHLPHLQRIMGVYARHRNGRGQQRHNGFHHVMGIIDRNRSRIAQVIGKAGKLFGSQRVGQGLVGHVAA